MWNIIKKYFEKELLEFWNKVINLNNWDYVDDVRDYLNKILNNSINLKELKEIWLTPTLVLIWKIEKSLKDFLSSNNSFYFFELPSNNNLNLEELNNYFKFEKLDEKIEVIEKDRVMIVRKEYKSLINPNIFLYHLEIFDHWDDTDDSKYFIFLRK